MEPAQGKARSDAMRLPMMAGSSVLYNQDQGAARQEQMGKMSHIV